MALQRGPLVYCLEQADNGIDLSLPPDAKFVDVQGQGVFDRLIQIETNGLRWDAAEESADDQPLYRQATGSPAMRSQPLTFIPYFAWANRGEGEMRVWVDER